VALGVALDRSAIVLSELFEHFFYGSRIIIVRVYTRDFRCTRSRDILNDIKFRIYASRFDLILLLVFFASVRLSRRSNIMLREILSPLFRKNKLKLTRIRTCKHTRTLYIYRFYFSQTFFVRQGNIANFKKTNCFRVE